MGGRRLSVVISSRRRGPKRHDIFGLHVAGEQVRPLAQGSLALRHALRSLVDAGHAPARVREDLVKRIDVEPSGEIAHERPADVM